MRPITLVVPYFENAGMLEEQQRVWSAYPDDLKALLHVIVVDDCSPTAPALPYAQTEIGLASYRLFRTQAKRRWNWLHSRNLGVDRATTDWVLLTDIDHVMPVETLAALAEAPLSPKDIHRLSRVDAPRCWPYALADCTPYKLHPNTWFLTRKMFDRVGGYDERLAGCYGTDGEFRDRVHQQARAVVTLSDVLIRYPRDIIPDASTTCFTRKGDPANDEELRKRREARAQIAKWRPLRLSFPVEQQL